MHRPRPERPWCRMRREPVRRELRDALQRPGLGEEMSGTGDDDEPMWAPQERRRPPVELEHLGVRAADDQEGRGGHVVQPVVGEVRAAPAGDDSAHRAGEVRRSQQRRCGARRSAEVPERQGAGRRLVPGPRRDRFEPLRQGRDVEDQLAPEPLVLGEEVEEQGGEALRPEAWRPPRGCACCACCSRCRARTARARERAAAPPGPPRSVAPATSSTTSREPVSASVRSATTSASPTGEKSRTTVRRPRGRGEPCGTRPRQPGRTAWRRPGATRPGQRR